MDATGPTHPSTTVFLQDACLHHKYIRTRDSSHVFERPERLRAVKIGLCAAISRLEETQSVSTSTSKGVISSDPDSLIAAIENLNLEQTTTDSPLPKGHPVQVIRSSAKIDILGDSAVKYIHGDVDGDTYLEKLTEWTRHSVEKVSSGQSEIPRVHLADSVSDFVGCHPRSTGHGMRGGRHRYETTCRRVLQYPSKCFRRCSTSRSSLWGRHSLWLLFRQ